MAQVFRQVTVGKGMDQKASKPTVAEATSLYYFVWNCKLLADMGASEGLTR